MRANRERRQQPDYPCDTAERTIDDTELEIARTADSVTRTLGRVGYLEALHQTLSDSDVSILRGLLAAQP
jgi:hypothetical protein